MSLGEFQLQRQHYLLLFSVALGGILAPLNSTMIAVALPELRDDFGISHATIAWLISAYLIAMAVAQPLGGRLSDQLGRVRVYRAGLVAFLICSLAATLAPNFAVLVVFRTGQAIAGAVLIPNGMAMLRESVPLEVLGRVNGLNGALIGTSAAAGPLLGAGLLALGSWRLLFLVNVPVVALALVLLIWIPYRDRPSNERPELDWRGTTLFASALVVLTFILGSLRSDRDAAVMGVAGLAFVLLTTAFAWSQFATREFDEEWTAARGNVRADGGSRTDQWPRGGRRRAAVASAHGGGYGTRRERLPAGGPGYGCVVRVSGVWVGFAGVGCRAGFRICYHRGH
jgi:MFS family permease